MVCSVANGSPAARSCSSLSGSALRMCFSPEQRVSGYAYPPLFRSIGIILAFVIPRVPSFATYGSNPLTSATGWFNQSIPAQFSRSPANFTFPANLQLQVDTNSNFLPVVFKRLDAQIYDLSSFRLVGTGHMNRTKLPAKQFINIQMPLNFSYLATNDSDLTCQSALAFPFSLVFLSSV